MRLFLAVELPGSVRDELARLQARLREEAPGWRWVRPEGIHLTLRFLGEVSEADDARCRGSWREAVGSHPPFRFSLRGLGGFPPRGRPRVLWVGIDVIRPAGSLPALAEAVESAARTAGFPAERRPFRAHLTLARAGRREPPRMPGELRYDGVDEIPAEEVVLYRSELHPSGARYTALDRYPLEG